MLAKPTPRGLVPFVDLQPRKRAPDTINVDRTPRKKRKICTPQPTCPPTWSPSASEFPPTSEEVNSECNGRGSYMYDFTGQLNEEDVEIPEEAELGDGDDDIPVRVLNEFAVYEHETGRMVMLEELLPLTSSWNQHDDVTVSYGASGVVKAWTEADDDDDDGDDAHVSSVGPVKLGEILGLSLWSVKERRPLAMDRRIYIRTKRAWYILGSPQPKYHPIFKPFWLKHFVFHLVVDFAIQNRQATLNIFLGHFRDLVRNCVEDKRLPSRIQIMERDIGVDDFEDSDVTAYLVSAIPPVSEDRSLKIKKTPLILGFSKPQPGSDRGTSHDESAFQPTFDSEFSTTDDDAVTSETTSNKHHRVAPKHKKKGIKPLPPTYLTPTVNGVANNFFNNCFEVSSSELDEEGNPPAIHIEHKTHHTDPEMVELLHPFEVDGFLEDDRPLEDHKEYFKSAQVDGTMYNVGDVVAVKPDKDQLDREPPEAYSVNEYANDLWFCQVRYFFYDDATDKKGKVLGVVPKFHGLWFLHGSRTIMQQTSHSKALFLIEECEDIHVASIVSKVTVSVKDSQDDDDVIEDVDDGSPTSTDYFCHFLYHQEKASFKDIPSIALEIHPMRSCFSCQASTLAQLQSETTITGNALIHHDVRYHCGDYVYLSVTGDKQPLTVGQLLSFGLEKTKKGKTRIKIEVALFDRFDNLEDTLKENEDDDERCLVYTDELKHFSPDELDGKCYVKWFDSRSKGLKKREEWVRHDDHFFFRQKKCNGELTPASEEDLPTPPCVECLEEERVRISERRNYLDSGKRLVGMELFSGGGGLSTGMDLSGFVETRYAVEYAPSAAWTHKTNHPKTKVFCQDTNTFLKCAVEGSPLPKNAYEHILPTPRIPTKRDGIDFIFGGPPCQSFSRMNHQKRVDDVRSTLPCNMLSYVEHYRPKYFLLENVTGILDHKFHREQQRGSETMHQTITYGMVKLILRILTALGYQASFQLLQAGQYGVPQSRQRVIFWGAKRGLELPEFPIPTHLHHGKVVKCTLPTGREKPPIYRSPQEHTSAPFVAISIDTAISDLPPFDWRSPYGAQPGKPAKRNTHEARSRSREANGIKQFDAISTMGKHNVGFIDGVDYPMEPRNRYQKFLRQKMDSQMQLTSHVTQSFHPSIVEIVLWVPLKPGADHRSVPADLLPLYAKKAKNSKYSYYGRLDAKGHFKCALTKIAPGSKGSWILHPSQIRTMSIRECARAQGFPDHYIFQSVDPVPRRQADDHIRIIGNAVAIPFALALGKELGKAAMKDDAQRPRGPSPEA